MSRDVEMLPATLERGWSPLQSRVARWLALGLTRREAAKREGVDERTVARWKLDGLEDLVTLLAQQGWQRLDPLLWRNIELALEINQQVMAGDVKHRDDRAVEARWILGRALLRATGIANTRLRGQADEWES